MDEKVIKVFADNFNMSVSQISIETRLQEDLQANSMHMFGLLAMLEGELGSAPEPASAMSMATVQDFIDFYK